jgi:hypothetical protein
MTSVVNVKDLTKPWPDDVAYIGRPMRGYPKDIWGNPFRIGDLDPNGTPMDRDAVLTLYGRYLEARVKRQPDFLEPLRGKRLACWCSPQPCHGDIIVEMLEHTKLSGPRLSKQGYSSAK